jgi:threonine aldolase
LDGARIFNAIVANNESTEEYGRLFDSISVCLSKGLGTPAGSVLIGKKAFIAKAKRVRKIFGGGMRQAGFYAAAGIYALDNNISRLAEDHTNARAIGEVLAKKDFAIEMLPVETNIVICKIGGKYSSATLAAELKKYGILSIAISPTQIRLVLHLDITREMVDKTIEVIEGL